MSESPSEPRVKRQKIDKKGRFAALEKLRNLKGQKHKCDFNDEVDNVYDVVDEKDFAKLAKTAYPEDWIEDDGTGYLEDGRDFFEDDDYNSDAEVNNSKKNEKGGKKRSRDTTSKPSSAKGSIRNLLSSAAVKKKKENVVKLEEDDILLDILGEMDSEKPQNKNNSTLSKAESQSYVSKTNKRSDDKIAKDYIQSFMKSLKDHKNVEPKLVNSEKEDDALLNGILKPCSVPNKSTDEISKNLTKQVESVKINKSLEAKVKEIHKPKADETVKPSPKKEKLENLEMDDHFDDMDYSILNDDENQFEKGNVSTEGDEQETKLKVENLVTDADIQLLSNWENVCKMDNFDDEIVENTNNISSNCYDESASNEMKFWFWDAWDDPVKRPGEVFLFGKQHINQNEFRSICVHVENVDRCLYILPREYILDPNTKKPTNKKVTFLDVYNEFNDKVATELGLPTFRSKKSSKNFSFTVPNVEVPDTCEYMEVRYEGKFPVPNLKKTYNTIAHIFGTQTPALETLLLECKIKGPCWLNLRNFRKTDVSLSWCKVEIKCPSPDCISVSEERGSAPPPISFLTLNVRTALNPKTTKNEIIMISCLVNNNFRIDKPPPNPSFTRHFCGFTRPIAQNWPFDLNPKLSQYKSTNAKKLDSERTLLNWFLAAYQNIDPDLVITHDANDCQLDIICDRIAILKIPMWSKIGRLKMSQAFGKKFKDFFLGRMLCDVKQSAEELIKSRSYDLDTLCTNILKLKEGERADISNDDLHTMYETGDGVLKLITLTMQDCSYILRLMCELNVLPLALQITNICGNLMSRTLQGGRSERNEYLLLHAFNEKNYIVPDKKAREFNWDQPDAGTQISNAGPARKKAAYSGGLVLEPIKGFYDKFILLMDFNSLYPSIIQEYNICFTTISKPENEESLPPVPEPNVEQGVLPRQIRRLVESRREVKKLMANPDLDPDQKIQYNIRQLALKLTANSMYGCLGFSHSRFFAQHLAALVTHKGREILMNTKSLVQKLNYDVIYGDTDSIMVNTNSTDYDQVFRIGHNIKQTINKIYKQIELDIDGVFKYLLLLKKKKYAALTISKTKKGEFVLNQEHKGLDIVRRDWSQISVTAGKLILNEILSDNQLDEKIETIHGRLEKFKQDVLDGNVPLQLLTITKQLTKAPKDYTAIQTLPHVQVAMRMNSTKNRRYKRGDMVSYIICEDGTDNPAMQRAYHFDELKSDDKLKVDTNYYLAQQIHPVVSRLCEPLEGTDASKIAECLGLDPSKFKIAAQRVQREMTEDEVGVSLVKSVVQKYRQCEKFKFTCVSCKEENIVASALRPGDKTHVGVLQKCSNPKCNFPPSQAIMSIKNQLVSSMRKCIRRFYENWMVCDDPSCNANTRTYSHVTLLNRPICIICKQGVLVRQYSERDLFHQLSYYQYMFDLSKHVFKGNTLPIDVEQAYNLLFNTVNQELERSGYCLVSLSNIFAQLKPATIADQIIDSKMD